MGMRVLLVIEDASMIAASFSLCDVYTLYCTELYLLHVVAGLPAARSATQQCHFTSLNSARHMVVCCCWLHSCPHSCPAHDDMMGERWAARHLLSNCTVPYQLLHGPTLPPEVPAGVTGGVRE
jgi:hypothetical protein